VCSGAVVVSQDIAMGGNSCGDDNKHSFGTIDGHVVVEHHQ